MSADIQMKQMLTIYAYLLFLLQICVVLIKVLRVGSSSFLSSVENNQLILNV